MTVVQEDIIIGVMGPTGVGKSTLIQTLTGEEALAGHDLTSCTQYPQAVRCRHPDGSGRSIVFLDTPGFNDTNVSDTDILGHIAEWLVDAYRKQTKLAGLLYLHRITDVRMTRTAIKNLELFRQLCGTKNLKNVVLVTMFWGLVDQSTGERRENELKNNFWRMSLGDGAQMVRYQDTHESGWSIVDRIAGKPPVVALVVDQIANQGLTVNQTAAGATVTVDVEEIAAQQRRELEAIQLEQKREMERMEEELRRRREQEELNRREQARIEEERRREIREREERLERMRREQEEQRRREEERRAAEARERARQEEMRRRLQEERERAERARWEAEEYQRRIAEMQRQQQEDRDSGGCIVM